MKLVRQDLCSQETHNLVGGEGDKPEEGAT